MNGLFVKHLGVGRLVGSTLMAAMCFVAVGLQEASPARAAVVDLGACNTSALSQPFAPWADFDSYELAPGGDFESPTWTMSQGAQLVAGSEPFAATGVLGTKALELRPGASALSPPTCVDAAYPTIRMFVGGSGAVEVYVVDAGVAIPVGIAAAGGAWEPSLPMSSDAVLIGALSGGTATVSIELVGLAGHPRVDDVFIDPLFRGS